MFYFDKFISDTEALAERDTDTEIRMQDPLDAMSANRAQTHVVVAGSRGVLQILKLRYAFNEDNVYEGPAIIKDVDLRAYRRGKVNILYSANNVSWNQLKDDLVATTSPNGSIVLWNVLRKNVKENIYKSHERTATCLSWHRDNENLLVSGSRDCRVFLYDIRMPNHVGSYTEETCEAVRDISFSPNSGQFDQFFTGDDSGAIRLWDLRNGKQPILRNTAHHSVVSSISFNTQDRYRLATAGGRDRCIRVWNFISSRLDKVFCIETTSPLGRVVWRPDRPEQLVSCASINDTSINVWDMRRPYIPYATFDDHKDSVTDMFWPKDHPDRFVSCGKDGLIIFHDIEDRNSTLGYACDVPFDMNVEGRLVMGTNERVIIPYSKHFDPYPGQGGSKEVKLDKYLREHFEKPPEKISYDYFTKTVQSVLTCGMPKYKEPATNFDIFKYFATRYQLGGKKILEMCVHNARVAADVGYDQLEANWKRVGALVERSLIQESYDQREVEDRKNFKRQMRIRQRELREEGKELEAAIRDEENWGRARMRVPRLGKDKSDQESLKNKLITDMMYKFNSRRSWSFRVFGKAENIDLPEMREVKERRRLEKQQIKVAKRNDLEEFLKRGATRDEVMALCDDICIWEPQIKGDLNICDGKIDHGETRFAAEEIQKIIRQRARDGDVQMAVSICCVVGSALLAYLDPYTIESWTESYIEMLESAQSFIEMAKVKKYTFIRRIREATRMDTTIHMQHVDCGGQILNDMCQKCGEVLRIVCSFCHTLITEMFYQCRTCYHTMHLEHAHEWFKYKDFCPADNCICQCSKKKYPWDNWAGFKTLKKEPADACSADFLIGEYKKNTKCELKNRKRKIQFTRSFKSRKHELQALLKDTNSKNLERLREFIAINPKIPWGEVVRGTDLDLTRRVYGMWAKFLEKRKNTCNKHFKTVLYDAYGKSVVESMNDILWERKGIRLAVEESDVENSSDETAEPTCSDKNENKRQENKEKIELTTLIERAETDAHFIEFNRCKGVKKEILHIPTMTRRPDKKQNKAIHYLIVRDVKKGESYRLKMRRDGALIYKGALDKPFETKQFRSFCSFRKVLERKEYPYFKITANGKNGLELRRVIGTILEESQDGVKMSEMTTEDLQSKSNRIMLRKTIRKHEEALTKTLIDHKRRFLDRIMKRKWAHNRHGVQFNQEEEMLVKIRLTLQAAGRKLEEDAKIFRKVIKAKQIKVRRRFGGVKEIHEAKRSTLRYIPYKEDENAQEDFIDEESDIELVEETEATPLLPRKRTETAESSNNSEQLSYGSLESLVRELQLEEDEEIRKKRLSPTDSLKSDLEKVDNDLDPPFSDESEPEEYDSEEEDEEEEMEEALENKEREEPAPTTEIVVDGSRIFEGTEEIEDVESVNSEEEADQIEKCSIEEEIPIEIMVDSAARDRHLVRGCYHPWEVIEKKLLADKLCGPFRKNPNYYGYSILETRPLLRRICTEKDKEAQNPLKQDGVDVEIQAEKMWMEARQQQKEAIQYWKKNSLEMCPELSALISDQHRMELMKVVAEQRKKIQTNSENDKDEDFLTADLSTSKFIRKKLREGITSIGEVKKEVSRFKTIRKYLQSSSPAEGYYIRVPMVAKAIEILQRMIESKRLARNKTKGILIVGKEECPAIDDFYFYDRKHEIFYASDVPFTPRMRTTLYQLGSAIPKLRETARKQLPFLFAKERWKEEDKGDLYQLVLKRKKEELIQEKLMEKKTPTPIAPEEPFIEKKVEEEKKTLVEEQVMRYTPTVAGEEGSDPKVMKRRVSFRLEPEPRKESPKPADSPLLGDGRKRDQEEEPIEVRRSDRTDSPMAIGWDASSINGETPLPIGDYDCTPPSSGGDKSRMDLPDLDFSEDDGTWTPIEGFEPDEWITSDDESEEDDKSSNSQFESKVSPCSTTGTKDFTEECNEIFENYLDKLKDMEKAFEERKRTYGEDFVNVKKYFDVVEGIEGMEAEEVFKLFEKIDNDRREVRQTVEDLITETVRRFPPSPPPSPPPPATPAYAPTPPPSPLRGPVPTLPPLSERFREYLRKKRLARNGGVPFPGYLYRGVKGENIVVGHEMMEVYGVKVERFSLDELAKKVTTEPINYHYFFIRKDCQWEHDKMQEELLINTVGEEMAIQIITDTLKVELGLNKMEEDEEEQLDQQVFYDNDDAKSYSSVENCTIREIRETLLDPSLNRPAFLITFDPMYFADADPEWMWSELFPHVESLEMVEQLTRHIHLVQRARDKYYREIFFGVHTESERESENIPFGRGCELTILFDSLAQPIFALMEQNEEKLFIQPPEIECYMDILAREFKKKQRQFVPLQLECLPRICAMKSKWDAEDVLYLVDETVRDGLGIPQEEDLNFMTECVQRIVDTKSESIIEQCQMMKLVDVIDELQDKYPGNFRELRFGLKTRSERRDLYNKSQSRIKAYHMALQCALEMWTLQEHDVKKKCTTARHFADLEKLEQDLMRTIRNFKDACNNSNMMKELFIRVKHVLKFGMRMEERQPMITNDWGVDRTKEIRELREHNEKYDAIRRLNVAHRSFELVHDTLKDSCPIAEQHCDKARKRWAKTVEFNYIKQRPLYEQMQLQSSIFEKGAREFINECRQRNFVPQNCWTYEGGDFAAYLKRPPCMREIKEAIKQCPSCEHLVTIGVKDSKTPLKKTYGLSSSDEDEPKISEYSRRQTMSSGFGKKSDFEDLLWAEQPVDSDESEDEKKKIMESNQRLRLEKMQSVRELQELIEMEKRKEDDDDWFLDQEEQPESSSGPPLKTVEMYEDEETEIRDEGRVIEEDSGNCFVFRGPTRKARIAREPKRIIEKAPIPEPILSSREQAIYQECILQPLFQLGQMDKMAVYRTMDAETQRKFSEVTRRVRVACNEKIHPSWME